MNNELAFAILEIIKKGESFGYNTVFTEVKKQEQFWSLKEDEYSEILYGLRDSKCIETISGVSQGYRYNDEKDSVKKYKDIIDAEKLKDDEDAEIKDLSKRKLKIDVKVGERVLKTYAFTRFAAWFGLISGGLLLLLKLLEVFGISLQKLLGL